MAWTARRILFGSNLHKSVSHFPLPRFLASKAVSPKAIGKIEGDSKEEKEKETEKEKAKVKPPFEQKIKTEEDLKKEPTLGVNRAYDEALKWFNLLRENKGKKIESTQKEIESIIAAQASLQQNFLKSPSEDLKQKIQNLQTELEQKEAELKEHKDWLWRTDPVREKRARYGLEKVEFPSLENLSNQEWKIYKADTRLRNMARYWGIFNDVLTGVPFSPNVNLIVKFGDQLVHRGHELTPTLTNQKPSVTFGIDRPGLFTLLLVDADEPNEKAQELQESVHWLVVNIPGKSKETEISLGKTVLDYIPPHPSKGTNPHRYVFVLFEQNSKDLYIENPPTLSDRFRQTTSLMSKYQLHPVGFCFFRASWDPTVTDVYTNILKRKEPIWVEPSTPNKKGLQKS